MPTYEFKCCDTTQEITVGIKEQLPKPVCSICSSDMQRVFSPFGISFKGRGFYANDKNTR